MASSSKWKPGDSHASSAQFHGSFRRYRFVPYISQSNVSCSAINLHRNAGCDFRQRAAIDVELSRRYQRITKIEAGKFTMHLAP
jgi:hypothetical protein